MADSSPTPGYVCIPALLSEVQLASLEGYAEADGHDEDVVIAYLDLTTNMAIVDWVANQWQDDEAVSLTARAEPWVPLSGDDFGADVGPAVQFLVSSVPALTPEPSEALLLVIPLMRQHLLVAWSAAHGRFMLGADVSGHSELECRYTGDRDSEGRGGMLFPVRVDPGEVEWAELAAWRRAFAATQ